MNKTRKASFVMGWTEAGEPRPLYAGPDAETAKRIYEDAVNGKHGDVWNVQLYLKPAADRRRDVPGAPKSPIIPNPQSDLSAQPKPEIAPQFVEALKDDDGPQEPDEIPAHAEVKPKPRGKGNKARD